MKDLTAKDFRFVGYVAIFAASALVLYDFVLELYCKYLYVGHHNFRQLMMIAFIVVMASIHVFVVTPVKGGEEEGVKFRQRWSHSGPFLAVLLLAIESMLDEALGSPRQLITWSCIVLYSAGVSFLNIKYVFSKGARPWLFTILSGMLFGAPLAIRSVIADAEIPALLVILSAVLSGALSSALLRYLLIANTRLSGGIRFALVPLSETLIYCGNIYLWSSILGSAVDLHNHFIHLWGQSLALAFGWGVAVDSETGIDEILVRIQDAKGGAAKLDRSKLADSLSLLFFLVLFCVSSGFMVYDGRTISEEEKEHIREVSRVEDQLKRLELE